MRCDRGRAGAPMISSLVFYRLPKQGRGAFTFLELLIVVLIIGLLAAILVPSLQRAKDITRRTRCLGNVRSISLAAHMYDSGCFPHCGKDETPPKPCPENLLVSGGFGLQGIFFCPSDMPTSFEETAGLFSGGGGFVQTVFWPAGDDGKRKHVRYMHNYDLRSLPYSIDGMQSSYIWEQGVIETFTDRSSIQSDEVILAEGSHVVNRGHWWSLIDPNDPRADQKHCGDTVNVLRANGSAETLAFAELVGRADGRP